MITSISGVCDTWTQKSSLTGVRDGCVSFSIGAKGYIGTGFDSGNLIWYTDFWEWDQASDTWSQKADFAGGKRVSGVGFSIGGKGYLGTGMAPSLKNDFWEYDPATNSWTQKADFEGASRFGAIGFSIGDKGYIGTGDTIGNLQGLKSDFWEWDQFTDTWAKKADFGGGERVAAIAFSIGLSGYVGTGADAGGVYFDDFWEWDQLNDVWIPRSTFSGGPRTGAVGFSIASKGFIGTGTSGVLKRDFWEWNSSTNQWRQRADFGGPQRGGATGFSIGNKGYIGMGFFFSSSANDFWEYCDTCLGVGLNEINKTPLISISPNPVKDKLIIRSETELRNSIIRILSINNEIIYESELSTTSDQIALDVSAIPNGTYVLTILSGSQFKRFKIIVQQ